MKKSFKKFMAFVMTGVLLCSPLTSAIANAAVDTESPAEGRVTASGDVEGYVNKDVFKVELPTEDEVDSSTFEFIMDPQQLINETNADAYENADFEEDATVFFKQADGTYASTSEAITVINKGTVAVDVAVTATIENADGITMATSDTFTDTTPSLYLALTSGDAASAVAMDAENGAELASQLAGVDEQYYEVTYDGSDYVYDLKADAPDSAFPTYSFALTGACNGTEGTDWSGLTDMTPTVSLVWTLTNAEAVAATETEVGWSSTGQYFYLSVPSVDSLDMTKFSEVRVAQDDVDEAVATYGKSESGKYITITWSTIKTNLLWPATNPGKTITFNFTYDGVPYTATYSAE